MSRPTHVYIVASPRPRSGKTLLARALAEFFLTDGRPVGTFDLDTLDATLARFLPKLTVRADIADTRGQVALFDELIIANEKPKVVDVSAHAYEPFLRVMEQIGFATEAPRVSVGPVILFAATAEPVSVRAYARLRERFPGLALVPVYNDGIMRGHKLRTDFPATSATALPLHLPMLSPSLRAIVDAPGFSFTEFRRSPPTDMRDILGDELNSWLKRVYLQFREMELRLLLTNLRGSLRGASPEPPPDEARPPA
ncbi:MAG TPA: hypothetical protein VKX28_05545 [Xanthobacteraceae bacterium]|nr:hypothetical protein [Xanthobacteraceae bacterium]